jgi:radical SAM superfamily enzyme YgiQ (UPF0313 family)
MKRSAVLLVNPNRMLPPIAPIGLEYISEDLVRDGYEPVLCDLTFAEDWKQALSDAVMSVQPMAVGFSILNIDDAYFASQDFILATTAEMIRHARSLTDVPIVLGGVGFSCAPCEVLGYTGADYGILGEGEAVFPLLLDRISSRSGVADVPGLVYRPSQDRLAVVKPEPMDLNQMPAPKRRFVDNVRYFSEGGQAGIETKRGCDMPCVYCVDPISKGSQIRLRTPESIVDEAGDLLDQGISVLHLCDCEFNLPPEHALAVCRALKESGMASAIKWYTYAAPQPFDQELAHAMADAGCVGINFGADHADAALLRRLGRNYGPDDLRRTVQACRDAGITVMFDMLFGSPGETNETIAFAINFLRALNPDCIGLSCGIRVYPHTALARQVLSQGPLGTNPHLHGTLENNEDLLRPIYYVDAKVGAHIHQYVSSLIGSDRRFFHADPAQIDGNYNYNNNSVLAQAIRNGARGAYWHILRKQLQRPN